MKKIGKVLKDPDEMIGNPLKKTRLGKLLKLDMVAPLTADPLPTSSTTLSKEEEKIRNKCVTR